MTTNALGTVAALRKSIPVHRGCARPLLVEAGHGTALWGGDGSLGLASRRRPLRAHAVTQLIEHLEKAPAASVTICPIGPLTNIAVLITMRPDLASRIERLVVMGGALEGGNASADAEFNIWFDPHAARIVLGADIAIVLATLDVTRGLVLTPGIARRLSRAETPAARLAARLAPLAGHESHPSAIFDAATIAFLLWPELFEGRRGRISVTTGEDGPRGRTTLRADETGPHLVLTGVDKTGFFERFVATLCREPAAP